MSLKHFAAEMKEIIEDAKAKGTTEIKVDNLIAYLDDVLKSPQPEPTEFQLEHYRGQLQASLEGYRATVSNRLEMLRSVIEVGQGAIKSSLLLNGGASVALLAFIGHLAQVRPVLVPEFAVCLLMFSLGMLLIAVTSGATYLSQWLYASDHDGAKKAGFWTNMLCIALGIASYGSFAAGLFVTYGKFQGFQ